VRDSEFVLCKRKRLCYTQPRANDGFALFLGSSAVEHPTVNRMVAGSNPARGAKFRFISMTCVQTLIWRAISLRQILN
jgi:hypothetical protein